MPGFGIKSELYGRTVIYSDVDAVTAENVASVLHKAKSTHATNASQINYLWDMYRGKQAIRNRTKDIRGDIVNKVCENRAYQIVSFFVGFIIGKPISYVTPFDDQSAAVRKLNDFMHSENKATEDQSLVMWQQICGTSFRLVLPKSSNEPDEAPFTISTVEPQNAFVVYSSKIGHKPLCGVYFYTNADKKTVYCVYTPTEYFEVISGKVVKEAANVMGYIPLIEYPANDARLGSIEIVASLLDEINLLDSDRIDGVEQFIQSILVFINCQPPAGETAQSLNEKGIIALPSTGANKADIKMIAEQLDQSQTQVLKEDIYQSILEIVGMPSVSNGNTSDSSNNGAVILKNGWQNAEAKAEACENMFRKSEREMLRVVLRICRELAEGMNNITLSALQIYFPRQNYGDIQTKAQVLTMLLNNDKVAPKIAYEACNMFKDPEKACSLGMGWYADETAAIKKRLTDKTSTVEDEASDDV